VTDIERADPIFIHGILPRSGTNFLWDLLLLHPDCAPPVEPVREDLFLDRSDHLVAFVDAVREGWDPRWGEVGPELIGSLYAGIGDGLLSFLWVDGDRRLVAKSPSVRNLERFFTLFPSARLLVLIRDGRAVTQSCMDTFGWEFERGARAWAEGARDIERFRAAHRDREERWRVVRYEDLVDHLEGTLPDILRSVGLDASTYDLDAARQLPVRGSSTFFGPGRSSVHWEPVPKDATFAPTERWRSWPQQQVERFEWIAGEESRALGYDVEPARRPFEVTVRHVALDAWWTTRRAATLARAGVGAATRPLRQRLGQIR
jgi:hypothetical protein